MVELESLRPYIPGSCRLRLFSYSVLHFLSNLLWLLVILSAVGAFCYVIYRIKQSQQNRTKKRAMRVREIVREVSCRFKTAPIPHYLTNLSTVMVKHSCSFNFNGRCINFL